MRETDSIDLSAAENALAAYHFAKAIGLPLNRTMTVNWNLADGGGDPRRRFARMQELARKWFWHRGKPLAWIYSHEHATGRSVHTHVALHVPRGLGAPFERQAPNWVAVAASKEVLKIGHVNDVGWIKYLLKDVEPVYYGPLGINPANRKYRSTRPIVGKRVGATENLTAAARDRWAAEHEQPMSIAA